MIDAVLHELATGAGLEIFWEDAAGRDQVTGDETLRAVLAAIGFPAGNDDEVRDSLQILRQETSDKPLPLTTATTGVPVRAAGSPGRFKLTLESGAVVEGMAAADAGGGVLLPAVDEAGYHQLEFDGCLTTLAIAPRCAHTLEQAGQGAKMWGLAVQLYALRRQGDGGIGDFEALREFVTQAAGHGADAVAISPVHAQFSADVTRFGPYAPSNRAAFNVLHIAEPNSAPDGGSLVEWPAAAAAKLHALRAAYENFHDHEVLTKFRYERGEGLERHAVFEALAASLAEHNRAALDWRNWPVAYQDPTNPAVARFIDDNAHEIGFHAYLQYRAEAGLQAAQQAAKDAGMRIGLIADLAVGTDHAGSHSWSRQHEVLRHLEIGAPPDLFNREGQSWGITAFSPRGLRNSGFSAFIDMLRHALRHAGGVRIDHVMGLARLWVVPHGFRSTEGAYLRMPAVDLMRLVILESQRHQAVILGEDLGTLPHGFQHVLDEAGIAGLRLMWFERIGLKFNPPALWTRTAAAMTTTHDLPTVAGWWESNDIGWRNKVGMGGDDEQIRTIERQELWAAFHTSGATEAPMPPATDGAAATYPAAKHLGMAGSLLALLPIEDVVSSVEQPNLPGTTDQHPNWRRRLPSDSETLFARADVAARLAALNEARKL